MAEIVSTSIRIPAELAAAIDSRSGDAYGEGRSSTILRDLGRYYGVLAHALAGPRFDEPEASLICDALNGCWLDDAGSPLSPGRARVTLLAEVEDAIALNGLDQKWSVDARLLKSKLEALTPVECLAVVDAVGRFWRAPDRKTDEMLREVGLVRDRRRAHSA